MSSHTGVSLLFISPQEMAEGEELPGIRRLGDRPTLKYNVRNNMQTLRAEG